MFVYRVGACIVNILAMSSACMKILMMSKSVDTEFSFFSVCMHAGH